MIITTYFSFCYEKWIGSTGVTYLFNGHKYVIQHSLRKVNWRIGIMLSSIQYEKWTGVLVLCYPAFSMKSELAYWYNLFI